MPLSLSPGFEINDPLSICEFLAESHPELGLWPQDQELRALARSVVSEMHSGFGEIRNTYHTNFVAKYEGNIPVSEKGRKEIERMLALWHRARSATIARFQVLGQKDEGYYSASLELQIRFSGRFYGYRFRTYNLSLATASPEALSWMKTMWSDPTLTKLSKDYFRQAENPETAIPHYDDIFKSNPDVQYGRFEEDWKFKY